MIFREANADDWPAISDISRKSGYEDYINRWGPAFLEEGTVIIAVEDKPVGFTKVEMMADGATWLSGLRVDPDQWRKGIGTKLTNEGVKKSVELGAYASRLLIEESNYRSRGLTEKMNFRNAGKYRFYEQGINLDGFSEVDFDEPGYITARWKFMRNERVENPGGNFFSDGKSLVFANNERDAFIVLKAGGDLKPAEDGMTVCESGFKDTPFSGLKIMEHFPTAILYEMKF